MIRLSLLVALALLGSPAVAGTAYQCTDASGKVSFQDKPCGGAQRQQMLHLDDTQPIATPPPDTSNSPVFETAAPPAPAPQPSAPLPVMYACVRATDGKTYTSDNGEPQPYQVPYGILGATQLPLSQVYGGPGAAGASAPELNRGRITPGLVANHYVWVQDQCRELTRAETCRALRDAFDDNEEKLRRAFKSDQPPLEQREQTLRAQLRNC
ncbi:DUF4124 domain-containing protein [Dyella japonica]|uniref:DUF4124 domain-containing protein n=1 Tax=Dyella japonica A8 TaxID=1217721 RepID=A0A075K5I7_9GAMM|nr:DUF4124 domain-containing protein [Dyella japonica]AIF49486.1 hypothetical protein HY57_20585 [Dyella japonica A8]